MFTDQKHLNPTLACIEMLDYEKPICHKLLLFYFRWDQKGLHCSRKLRKNIKSQVLEQLKQIEVEREERKRKKDAMIKEYLDKKEKERIEAEKEEEEQQLKSQYEKNDNQDSTQGNEAGEEINENM